MAEETPDFTKGNVALRDVLPSDLGTFFEHQCDEIAHRMAAFAPRDKEAFDAHWARIIADADVVKKAVVVNGIVVGNVVSWSNQGRREIGYWIGRPYWGMGIASRALRLFLDFVEFRPLHAHVAKHNIGSIRVLEKCGFIVCGEDKVPSANGDQFTEEFVFLLR